MADLRNQSIWDKYRAAVLTARASSTDPAGSGGNPPKYVKDIAVGSLPTKGDVSDLLRLIVAMTDPSMRAQAGKAVMDAASKATPRDAANMAANMAVQTALGGGAAAGTYKGAGALLRTMLQEYQVQYIKGMLGIPFTSKTLPTRGDKRQLKGFIDEVLEERKSPTSIDRLMRPPAIEIARRNPAFREALKRREVVPHSNSPYLAHDATLGKFYSYKDSEGKVHITDWYHFYPWGPFDPKTQAGFRYDMRQRALLPEIIKKAISKHKFTDPYGDDFAVTDVPFAGLLEALAIRRGAGRHMIDWKLPEP
jgi:hypothetical protein